MINKDTIVLLNKSDVQNKQNHEFDADTVLASVKENNNIEEHRKLRSLRNKLKKSVNKDKDSFIRNEF